MRTPRRYTTDRVTDGMIALFARKPEQLLGTVAELLR
jgi:hypothetical protein